MATNHRDAYKRRAAAGPPLTGGDRGPDQVANVFTDQFGSQAAQSFSRYNERERRANCLRAIVDDAASRADTMLVLEQDDSLLSWAKGGDWRRRIQPVVIDVHEV
ncbi:MAG: hypothetical protein ACRDTG_26465 [Pseudonocardiaceae bacterium]